MELSPAAQHLLYVLLDSNLPTGGFVASSGLESYAKHGFLAANVTTDAYDEAEIDDILAHLAQLSGTESGLGKDTFAARRRHGPTSAAPGNVTTPTVRFVKYELDNFHNSTRHYLRHAYAVVSAYLAEFGEGDDAATREKREAAAVEALVHLDAEQESTLLSQVQRRASKTQGVALLTLYGRGLAPPPSFFSSPPSSSLTHVSEAKEEAKKSLISSFKLRVRRGKSHGHLSLCFGVLCALLEIPPRTAHHVYLFTHLRSILSAGVRLNLIGPYLSTQILSWDGRRIIDDTHDVRRPWDCAAPVDAVDAAFSPSPSPPPSEMRNGVNGAGVNDAQPNGEQDVKPANAALEERKPTQADLVAAEETEVKMKEEARSEPEDIWAWAKAAEAGPCTTWPLIEILTSRHDLQHSRIFNS